MSTSQVSDGMWDSNRTNSQTGTVEYQQAPEPTVVGSGESAVQQELPDHAALAKTIERLEMHILALKPAELVEERLRLRQYELDQLESQRDLVRQYTDIGTIKDDELYFERKKTLALQHQLKAKDEVIINLQRSHAHTCHAVKISKRLEEEVRTLRNERESMAELRKRLQDAQNLLNTRQAEHTSEKASFVERIWELRASEGLLETQVQERDGSIQQLELQNEVLVRSRQELIGTVKQLKLRIKDTEDLTHSNTKLIRKNHCKVVNGHQEGTKKTPSKYQMGLNFAVEVQDDLEVLVILQTVPIDKLVEKLSSSPDVINQIAGYMEAQMSKKMLASFGTSRVGYLLTHPDELIKHRARARKAALSAREIDGCELCVKGQTLTELMQNLFSDYAF